MIDNRKGLLLLEQPCTLQFTEIKIMSISGTLCPKPLFQLVFKGLVLPAAATPETVENTFKGFCQSFSGNIKIIMKKRKWNTS